MIELIDVRHAYPEKAGFFVDRPDGIDNYTFLHFFNPVELSLLGERRMLMPHATLIYGMFTPQYYRMPSAITHDWFHFTTGAQELSRLGIRENVIYYPQYPDFITKIVREMEHEFFSPGTGTRELVDAKVRELLIKTVRASTGEMEPPTDKSTLNAFRALRAEMFLNLGEGWTVEKMANAVNLSPSRFFTVYKNVFHTPPMEDLIRARMNKAKDLLVFENAPISDIAREVGYVTLPHFSRLFSRHMGLSPQAYRRRMKEKRTK